MGMVHSLNVSVATSLILYEAMRQREAAGMYAQNRIPPDDFERRLFEWAYPSIAARRRAEGRPYPPLTADGELVRVITGKVMGETFGFDTTGMGDVDGDGTIDLLLTSAWSAVAGGRSGRMFIVSGSSGAVPR